MARWPAVRWLLWSGIAGAGLVAAAALSYPLWLQPLVERRASVMLARPVTIGHLHLLTSGRLAASAEDVIIGNPPGFPPNEEPFLRVPRLTVLLDVVKSIRQRKIVFTSVQLERPMVHATATADGQDNYHLHSVAGAGALINLVGIVDGRAFVSVPVQHTALEVTFAAEPVADKAVATRITAEARGTYADQPLTAQFEGGAPRDSVSPSPGWPITLSIQNGPTRASARGTLEEPLNLHSATASLLLAGPDMALLRSLTGVPFPATPPYELHGRLDYAAGIYRLTDASGRLGRSDVAGTMTVAARAEARPEITAELLSHNVALTDIEALLRGEPVVPGTPGETAQQHAQASRLEAESRASPRVFPTAPFHLEKLERTDLHLTYRAERIQGAAMPFDDLVLRMDVVDGAATLHPLSFGVGDGRIAGEVWLTPQKGALRARADIKLAQLDVSHLMRASGRFRGAGALNGTAHLEGVGRSIAEILGNADGALSLWMAGGDLSSLLVNLVGLRLGNALLSGLGRSPNTHVECFVGDLELRRGLLAIRRLLMKTEDAVTEGVGEIDLGREQVNVQLRTASRRFTVGVVPAPLLIDGTFKNLRAAPAVREGLVGNLAKIPTIQPGIGDGPRCDGSSAQSER